MTKDDAAVNLSLKAARCLGNLSDLHCSRDWKCAANRRFQLIKPNLLILRPFPICGAQALCPQEVGHPGSSLPHCFLAPGRPWTPPDSYGRGWRGGKRPWCAGYLCVHLECLLEGWKAEERGRQQRDHLDHEKDLIMSMLSPHLSPLLKETPFLRIGNKPGATCYKCGLLNPPRPFFSPH